jgi:RpiB/LacA/LacB family sugar-phosphate isomerase
MAKTVSIGADHGGFELKEKVKEYLQRTGYRVKDLGTNSSGSCDYPEHGFAAAREVALRKAFRGVVICKSGIGMSIVANKLPGVRAALCFGAEDALSSREHNDANVLVLSASRTPADKAFEILDVWMSAKTLPGRHARRVKAIKEIEKSVFKKIR